MVRRSLLWLALASSAVAVEEAAADVAEIASAAGVSVAAVQSQEATSCGVGTYYWGQWKGRHYCVKCPAGYTSGGCANCSPDPTRTSCYQPANCQKGKFFDKAAKTCTKCPQGKWQSAAGKALCYDCPTGMFQPTAGLYSCYWCPKGQYGATTGGTKCAKCNTCAKGEFGSTAGLGKKAASDCACSKCEKGKYAPAGYTLCFNCPTGRFQHQEGMYSCYYCPTGKFTDTTGKGACSSCPNGKTTAAKGQDAAADCTIAAAPACKLGKYRYMEKETKKYFCLDCPVGMFGKLVSEAYGGHCYACPAGQTQAKTGQSSCDKLEPYTVHFKTFNYKEEATLASAGWSLLSYTDMATYKDLFLEEYKRNKGLSLIAGFTSSSCCLTVKQGYRITANSKSYVYPMDATGTQLRCAAGGNAYTAGLKYKLSFHDGTKFVDLSKATSLFAAQGSGLCATKAGEQNPGIFMGKVKGGISDSPTSFCKTINKQLLCLETTTGAPTPTPTVPPTNAPTVPPTKAPTEAPTKFPTKKPTQAPTKYPTKNPTPQPTRQPTDAPTYAPPTPAPIDCIVTGFGPWGRCTEDCGGGVQYRHRVVAMPQMFGGKACPSLLDERNCNTHICPVHCRFQMRDWSICSKTCGFGVQFREPVVYEAAKHGGKECPLRSERSCNTYVCPTPSPTPVPTATPTHMPTEQPTPEPTRHPTAAPTHGPTYKPVDCDVTAWGIFSACSYTCGGGTQFRVRTVLTHAAHGGKRCPTKLHHTKICNTDVCPVDCRVTYWSNWGECSKTCGVGAHMRSRSVVTHSTAGGKECPHSEESESCTDGPCPVHCDVTEFTAWTTCNKSCGGGSQKRQRSIVRHAQHGGFTCPFLSETRGCATDPCPIDCVVSKFNSFSDCTATCGSGSRTRTRTTATAPFFGGKACPALQQVEKCNTQACPDDCDVSYWSSWETCSTSCGKGEQIRVRTVMGKASNGGKECPILKDERSCTNPECPVHCETSMWTGWSDCSRTCGPGVQARNRVVYSFHRFGGIPCPALDETQACNTRACPVDCAVSAYKPWNTCSKSCDSGSQKRWRTVVTKMAYNGQICPPLFEERGCNTHSCPVDCKLAEWGAWDPCARTCGGGTEKRQRHVLVFNSGGGKFCGPTSQSRACNEQACPVDCTVSDFSAWGDCSKSCGSGKKTRTRSINREVSNGGKACPTLNEAETCNVRPCPIDCVVSEWASWTECSKTCGSGMQDRTRTVVTDVAHGGKDCPKLTSTQVCSDGPCPVHCDVTAFSNWTPCSKKCGSGFQSRSRTVTTHAKHGGYSCPFLDESRSCNNHACAVDCVVSPFSAFSPCSVSCGTGTQTRQRTVTTRSLHGGKECPNLNQSRQCNVQYCPVDCVAAAWEPWSECTHTCGGGHHWRMRSVKVNQAYGGTPCPVLSQQGACNVANCPTDCIVSTWSVWGACSLSCGSGLEERSRHVTTAASAGGKECPSETMHRVCNTAACPIDCEVSNWTPWTSCSKSCGSGAQSRSRSITRTVVYGGKICPTLSKTRTCNASPCAVDCIVSEWSNWTPCSKTCSAGTQTHTRVIDTPASHGGALCPALSASEACSDGPCPVHCEVSKFSAWSECTLSCSSGKQQRTREVVTHAQHGGYTCPFLDEQRACNVQGCPVDCIVSDDKEWSACSVTCGTGVQSTPREIITPPAYGGRACAEVRDHRSCSAEACPIDCVVSGWSAWSSCSRSCGAGVKDATRSVSVEASYGGKACPSLEKQAECNVQSCPVDCVTSSWDNWGVCTVSCGSGSETRTRSITRAAAHGGSACNSLSETRLCNSFACPIDCVVSEFNAWGSCSTTCGFGSQSRTRTVQSPATLGGRICASLTETMVCSGGPCPVHCEVTEFSAWTQCTRSCGKGSKARKRSVVSHETHGGYTCPDLVETVICNAQACPGDCAVSKWSAWDACTHSCGSGSQTKARTVTSKPTFGGMPCPDLSSIQSCNTAACAVDCVLSDWGSWTTCSLSCGGGLQDRHRSVLVNYANGGKSCAALKSSQSCKSDACPVDCKMSAWGVWGDCSRSCGTGHQEKSRIVETSASNGGKGCPASSDRQMCKTQACPVDCIVSKWSAWNDCSTTCSSGSQTRTRVVGLHVAFGGVECPNLSESRACNHGPCPVHCEVTMFGEWGSCTKSCGSGIEKRTRSIVKHANHGGYTCPSLSEERECNIENCPIDCVMNDWTAWSSCTHSCGGGSETRTRSVATAVAYGGKQCEATKAVRVCNDQACPVDCALSEWTVWSDCSKTCGSGTTSRSRSVHVVATNGGATCGALEESKKCSDGPCPVHCSVSAFGIWIGCTKTCGTGSQTRSRSVTSHASHGGYTCPALVETRDCNTQACPVNCRVSFFSDWSACSLTCGSGSQTRTRSVTTSASNGGVQCPGFKESQACSDGPCPIHCEVTGFSGWSECTRSCGSGSHSRSRSIVTHAAHGGYICPGLVEHKDCHTQACPVDCVMSSFSEWTSCSLSCGTGAQTKVRTVVTPAAFGGSKCPDEKITRTCNTLRCPIDCKVSAWKNWGTCTKSCGTGTSTRTRQIMVATKFGGVSCPTLTASRNCNAQACPIDCVVSAFSDYAGCSKTCGTGYQSRTRTTSQASAYGGKICPALSETRMCNTTPCAIDCQVDQFTAWSECSKSCAQGTQQRTRAVVVDVAHGGVACPSLEERQACSDGPCPIHCEVTDFSRWTECSKTCGAGTQNRKREITAHAAHGGYTCPFLKETRFCESQACPVDCVVSDFAAWSTCTVTCGTGGQYRKRVVTVPVKAGGKSCPSLRQNRACATQACPIDCTMSAWEAYGACSLTCGKGVQRKVRSVTRSSAFGGIACAAQKESRACNEDPCPVDCLLTKWGPFGACSASCNRGQKTRTRQIHRAPAFGGRACQTLVLKEFCNLHSCPIDCVQSEWSKWSGCSTSCGSGTDFRTRSTDVAAAFGGEGCNGLRQQRTCNTKPCPVDCVVSEWEKWTGCSNTCGDGIQQRTRALVYPANHGGRECPALKATRKCNDGPCPVHCEVSKFSEWSTCTKSCGSGTQDRSRDILAHANHGGYVCPLLSEVQQCSTQPCAVDCTVSVFSAWSTCTTTCGSGQTRRTRTVDVATAHGGKLCPPLEEEKQCNVHACPIDCILSKWERWGVCSKSCGTGDQTRTRNLERATAFGGSECSALSESRLCNKQACPVDCTVSEFSKFGRCSKTCGTGARKRSRKVLVAPQNGGKQCPALTSSVECNAHHCAFDCAVSEFSNWSECSKSCGPGFKSRKRHITDKHKHGGVGCPHLIETENCEENTCPVDCVMSKFTRWSYCTATCGIGSQTRSRTVVTSPKHGGKDCSALSQTRACNQQSCPVDCIMKRWSKWSTCSLSCGVGSHSRSRKVKSPAANGGRVCGALKETKDCNEHHCAVDCELTKYSPWTACSATCNGAHGAGWQSRQRKIITHHQHGGSDCPHLTEKRSCATEFCPIDCKVGTWGEWHACSKSCGSGSKYHERALIHLAAHGGASCPPLIESKSCNAKPCPIDCKPSAWGAWSQCTKTCGQGVRTRRRSVQHKSVYGGKACGALAQKSKCNIAPCPVDCTMTEWAEWSNCDKTCSLGSRSRTRSVSTSSSNGGTKCPGRKETQACNDGPCPSHCQVTPFGPWSECSRTCGSGTATRSRSVVSKNQHGGYVCPFLDETRECKTTPCPLDCVVGKYGKWSACTKSCGMGTQRRSRVLKVASQNGGAACPTRHQKRDCNTQLCAQDCTTSPWSVWTGCSKTCGAGFSTRQRSIVTPATNGGVKCPTLSESNACNDGSCPVACQVSAFERWNACTKTCGMGTQRRSRKIISHATHGGYICPSLSESRDCNTEKCPIDCLMSSFTKFGKCDKSCGTGAQTQTRTITRPAQYGGNNCAETLRSRACNTRHCAVDCVTSKWRKWQKCSRTCGQGTQTRYRKVTTHAGNGGTSCPSLMETRGCNVVECPIDCVVSSYSDWGACSRSCNSGTQTRTRKVVTSPIFAGKECPVLSETQGCNAHPCPVACVVSSFGKWSACTKSCGTGHRVSSRSVKVDMSGGGMACPALVRRSKCNAQPCPTDCVLSAYSDYGECSKSCGGGSQSRTRSISVDVAFGGMACASLTQKKGCNEQPCPANCRVSQWALWSHCSRTCSAGFQARTRVVKSEAKFGGKKCPKLTMTQACNNGPCPVHCDVSPFGEWSECTLSCGTGSQTRSRTVVSTAKNGGYVCPFLSESRLCRTRACPVDCVVAAYSKWSACSQSCGTGYQSRTRKITTRRQQMGKACPALKQSKKCNLQSCPEDCTLSAFGDWTTCSKTCGGGSQTRTRSVTRESAYGGAKCATLSNSRACNSFACPIDCTVSKWERWSICSNSCGGGIQSRSRTVSMEFSHGGKSCPHLAESQACKEEVSCPVDCVVSTFGPYTECSKTCGEGQQTRQRQITTTPLHGGKACPALEQSSKCNVDKCPVDCELGAWKEWTGCAVKCGGGLKTRRRPVLRKAEHGGKACAARKETNECNAQGCGCTHVYCVVQPGTRHIKVMHHRLERGGRKHRCKYNYGTQNCECMCYNDVKLPFQAA